MKVSELTGISDVSVLIDKGMSTNERPKFYFSQNDFSNDFEYAITDGFVSISNPLNVVLR